MSNNVVPEEFLDYIEQVEQNAKDQAMYKAHAQWQQETWGGRLSLLILRIGNIPIVQKFLDTVLNLSTGQSSNDNEWPMRVLRLVLILLIVLVIVTVFHIAASMIQLIIGREIVVNQEIQVIEEIKLSDLLQKDGEGEESDLEPVPPKDVKQEETMPRGGRRSARERKQKDA